MNVAWALFWVGSRGTKSCIFPCKVASAGDEKYLVCAAVAAGVVPDVMGSSSVFCTASRLLGAAAACVILVPFAAGSRK